MITRQPAIYILASGERGTLYIGVTSDLVSRVHQHKHDLADGFSKRYRVHMLVWYELYETMESAIGGEKTLEAWKTGLEDRTGRIGQPRLARSVSRYPVEQDGFRLSPE